MPAGTMPRMSNRDPADLIMALAEQMNRAGSEDRKLAAQMLENEFMAKQAMDRIKYGADVGHEYWKRQHDITYPEDLAKEERERKRREDEREDIQRHTTDTATEADRRQRDRDRAAGDRDVDVYERKRRSDIKTYEENPAFWDSWRRRTTPTTRVGDKPIKERYSGPLSEDEEPIKHPIQPGEPDLADFERDNPAYEKTDRIVTNARGEKFTVYRRKATRRNDKPGALTGPPDESPPAAKSPPLSSPPVKQVPVTVVPAPIEGPLPLGPKADVVPQADAPVVIPPVRQIPIPGTTKTLDVKAPPIDIVIPRTPGVVPSEEPPPDTVASPLALPEHPARTFDPNKLPPPRPAIPVRPAPEPEPVTKRPGSSKGDRQAYYLPEDEYRGEGDEDEDEDRFVPASYKGSDRVDEINFARGAKQDLTPELARLFTQAGEAYGVDPRLLAGLAYQESRYNPRATGKMTRYGKARGMMQFIDATARRFGLDDAYNPVQAVRASARYMGKLLDMFDGNPALALAGYNWGEGNVKNWIKKGADPRKMPAETYKYIGAITGKSINEWMRPQRKEREPERRKSYQTEDDPLYYIDI